MSSRYRPAPSKKEELIACPTAISRLPSLDIVRTKATYSFQLITAFIVTLQNAQVGLLVPE
jgi:hypothetical protein